MKQNADLNRHQSEQDDNYEDTAFHFSFCENWIHKIQDWGYLLTLFHIEIV